MLNEVFSSTTNTTCCASGTLCAEAAGDAHVNIAQARTMDNRVEVADWFLGVRIQISS